MPSSFFSIALKVHSVENNSAVRTPPNLLIPPFTHQPIKIKKAYVINNANSLREETHLGCALPVAFLHGLSYAPRLFF